MPPRDSRFRETCLMAAILFALSSSTGLAQPPAETPVILEAPMAGFMGIGPAFTMTQVEPSGTIRMKITERLGKDFSRLIATIYPEGYFLLLSPIGNGMSPFEVIRAQVTDIAEGPEFTVVISPEAASRIKPGEGFSLLRPIGATTARMRALPALIPFEKEQGQVSDPAQLLNRTKSINNLKQIGLAIHNFESTYACFPPAVIYGPDGKPWHSWRVLILPFLEQGTLYQEYDFNEPWDSEKNRKLIPRMPNVYREPASGNDKSSFAQYAAVVGPKALFSPQGETQSGRVAAAAPIGKGGRRIFEITDGTSNTIAIVPVEAAREIPWTKPEDVNVGPDFPTLGKPGGIATPYTLGVKPGAPGVAPILYADGSVHLISSTIQPRLLASLLTYNGGEVISSNMVPHDLIANQTKTLKIRIVGDRATASLD